MKHELPVANHVISLISELQNAGFEAYIVGGAIRDLLSLDAEIGGQVRELNTGRG